MTSTTRTSRGGQTDSLPQPADTSADLLGMSVGDALREAAAQAPDLIAIVEGAAGPRRQLTYAGLLTAAEQAARALLTRFRPGQHVAVWAGNSLEWILLEYAAALAGLVLVTVNPAYQASELAYVLGQSRSAGLFHMASYRGNPLAEMVTEIRQDLPALREVIPLEEWAEFVAAAPTGTSLPAVASGDHLQIQYTSGTTGFPKGVLLNHRSVFNNARLVMRRLRAAPGDVFVWPMPLFHTAGCGMGVLGALASRASLVCLTRFDPALQLELVESMRGTITGGVPTMLIAMLGHPDSHIRDLSSLRCVGAGGAPVPVEVARECERRFSVPFFIAYGTTECSPIITQTRLDDPAERRTGTLGTALPHTEVRIVELANGGPAPVGEVGELCARGYLVMSGYHDDPEATAAAIDGEGWYHTGDLASMDADGCVRVAGRLKDMIIRGGENVYPKEIEDILHAHPAVADVAVVGKPDDMWGETVAAFVRLTPDCAVTEAELHAYCRTHLAAYKTPATWLFVDEFPLTASGKVRKKLLRERLAN
jgi:acyl-CoA synthetase (AMP-forming)/AMP-acid ligase II